MKNSCKREPALENVFRSFNEMYFRGKLPRYHVVVCSRSRKFSHFSAGYCSPEERKIFLRSGVSLGSTIQTLTHEMIHAKLWWVTKNVHGGAFVNELKRLRNLGAPLSKSELDITKESMFGVTKLTRQNVENSIRYAVENENLPARLVPKFLELEFNLPYSVIRRHVHLVPRMIILASVQRKGRIMSTR